MKLDEAIDTNERMLRSFPVSLSEDEVKAIKLANEALKRIQALRADWSLSQVTPLLGETEK